MNKKGAKMESKRPVALNVENYHKLCKSFLKELKNILGNEDETPNVREAVGAIIPALENIIQSLTQNNFANFDKHFEEFSKAAEEAGIAIEKSEKENKIKVTGLIKFINTSNEFIENNKEAIEAALQELNEQAEVALRELNEQADLLDLELQLEGAPTRAEPLSISVIEQPTSEEKSQKQEDPEQHIDDIINALLKECNVHLSSLKKIKEQCNKYTRDFVNIEIDGKSLSTSITELNMTITFIKKLMNILIQEDKDATEILQSFHKQYSASNKSSTILNDFVDNIDKIHYENHLPEKISTQQPAGLGVEPVKVSEIKESPVPMGTLTYADYENRIRKINETINTQVLACHAHKDEINTHQTTIQNLNLGKKLTEDFTQLSNLIERIGNLNQKAKEIYGNDLEIKKQENPSLTFDPLNSKSIEGSTLDGAKTYFTLENQAQIELSLGALEHMKGLTNLATLLENTKTQILNKETAEIKHRLDASDAYSQRLRQSIMRAVNSDETVKEVTDEDLKTLIENNVEMKDIIEALKKQTQTTTLSTKVTDGLKKLKAIHDAKKCLLTNDVSYEDKMNNFITELKKNREILNKRRDSAFLTFVKALGVATATLAGLVAGPVTGYLAYQRLFGKDKSHGSRFVNEMIHQHQKTFKSK